MRVGICTPIDQIQVAEKIGFDYIEPAVVNIVQMTEDEYKEALREVKEANIGCEVFNILFPGDTKLVGPEVNLDHIKEYLEGAFERIAKLGAKVVVFGSGGARRVPQGLSPEDGWNDLVNTARLVGEVASQYDITIAMEPLNKKETNIINSVSQGIKFVHDVDHPNIRLLADFYHMRMENESMDIIGKTTSELLVHTHIARGHDRYFPQTVDEDTYSQFFSSLKDIGYKGRISIEGGTKDVQIDGPVALDLLKELAR